MSVTIARNSRKLPGLKTTLTRCLRHDKASYYRGVPCDPVHAWAALNRYRQARLTTADERRYTIHVNDSLWYELAAGPPAHTGTCRHCGQPVTAQGPRPDWAAVDSTEWPVLWCPDAPAGDVELPVHEPGPETLDPGQLPVHEPGLLPLPGPPPGFYRDPADGNLHRVHDVYGGPRDEPPGEDQDGEGAGDMRGNLADDTAERAASLHDGAPEFVSVQLTFKLTPQNRADYAREYGLGGFDAEGPAGGPVWHDDPAKAGADFREHLPEQIREALGQVYMIREFSQYQVGDPS
jgi:hypothetical protein